MTKTNKTKAAANEVTEKVHVGEDATVYANLLDRYAAVTGELARSQINWYWLLGQIYDDFAAAGKAGQVGKRTIADFARDLTTADVVIGESTLYTAHALFRRYAKEAIDKMVAVGFRIGHLKALAVLSDEQANKIAPRLVDSKGKVNITIEKLNALITEERQASAKVAIAKAKEPEATSERGPSAPELNQSAPAEENLLNDSESDAPGDVEPETQVHNPDGKTGSVGAAGMKEFSKPPLKALKAIESTSTKLLSLYADGLIAVKEAGKIGFDSTKAQENYRLALATATTALAEAFEGAKGLLAEMRASQDDQQRQQ